MTDRSSNLNFLPAPSLSNDRALPLSVRSLSFAKERPEKKA